MNFTFYNERAILKSFYRLALRPLFSMNLDLHASDFIGKVPFKIAFLQIRLDYLVFRTGTQEKYLQHGTL